MNMNVFVRVFAAGDSLTVCRADGSRYFDDLEYHENITTGEIILANEKYFMNNAFGQALQIGQAAIIANKYATEMNKGSIGHVTIKYPHIEKTTNCFYSRSDFTI